MTTSVPLNASQLEAILETEEAQVALIKNAAAAGAIAPTDQFVYFAAFDGTDNDLENVRFPKNTNVAQLYLQAGKAPATGPYLAASYYPGPGTKGTVPGSSWESAAVTAQVIATAKRCYEDFTGKALAWLKQNPGKPVAIALTSFSRGCASAAILTQIVFEKGLPDPAAPDEPLVAPGKLTVAAGVLFDPVMTGVQGNVAFAPNTRNIVHIRAQDEYRRLFKAPDYSAQAFITCIDMLGCHADIGGGYDNGIGALTLAAATDFFRLSGLPMADVDPSRTFSGASAVAIHSEEFDNSGNQQWDVYGHFAALGISSPSPRLADRAVRIVPATAVTTGGYTMTLYDGRSVTIRWLRSDKDNRRTGP